MESSDAISRFVLLMSIFYLTKIVIFVGGSIFLLWVAFRYVARAWVRRGIVVAVVVFWLVDLVPGAFGFHILCRTRAGIEVASVVEGRPLVMIGERIPSAIAARILFLSGGVEHALARSAAGRLGLAPGLYRFQSLEDASPDCLQAALRDSAMLSRCAEAVPIDRPIARYMFDSDGPDDTSRPADAGPLDLSWWVERHVTFVVDRETDTTLATTTLLLRREIPSVTGLFSFDPRDAACPRGATAQGLPYLLMPAVFPDLTGRDRRGA